MIITVAGKPGAGKTTVSKILAYKLKLDHYYMGKIMREMAKSQNKTLQEFYNHAEDVDKKVDEYQTKLGLTEDEFIIEGRTSFNFIPNSIKIYLDVELEEGAKRIFNQAEERAKNQAEKKYETVEEALESIKERISTEKKRYKEIYDLDYDNPENFDILIDTTEYTVEEVVEKIIECIKKIEENGQ